MGAHCCAVLLPASCGLFLFNKGRFNMSDMWEGATWNENGELVIDVYANPPDVEPNEFDETDEDFEYETDEELDENEPKHTYATIDCGGECGGCVALVVDDEVVSGPPFHPNCQCSLNLSDIENADYHDSHLHQDVASDRSVDTRDIKWLKMALVKLGYYTPDSRAGESNKRLNQYPNQRLFDAIENFRKENKIKETGAVKPGHWTEVKINEALKKKIIMKNVLTKKFKEEVLKFEGIKQHFYLDSKNILTVGIGQNISELNKFKELNILDTQTGNVLDEPQKEQLYSQIMQEISDNTFKEKNYSNLEISKNDIYNQFNTMLEKSYNELEQKIENFNDFPISVKQALVDMQFNMGNKKFSDNNWPKLFQAIDNRDWRTAGKEARQRKDVQKSRREWTYKMFIDAK